jgi:L-lactate dehydrogenase complex protein LldG
MSQGAEMLAELAEEHRWNKIGVADHALCHTLTDGLPNHTLLFERSNSAPAQMAELSAGLVSADAFLADTGSALIRCATKEQRLLCYLPPVSIVVAQTNQIVANLPSVWRSISDELRQTQGRGETVVVTGPSRSSDIEKRLVVGVHGPQRVIALLIGCVR